MKCGSCPAAGEKTELCEVISLSEFSILHIEDNFILNIILETRLSQNPLLSKSKDRATLTTNFRVIYNAHPASFQVGLHVAQASL